MSDVLEKAIREGVRGAHNFAIDAAVKMILICQDESIAGIVAAVNSLKIEESTNDRSRPTLAPTGEAP